MKQDFSGSYNFGNGSNSEPNPNSNICKNFFSAVQILCVCVKMCGGIKEKGQKQGCTDPIHKSVSVPLLTFDVACSSAMTFTLNTVSVLMS